MKNLIILGAILISNASIACGNFGNPADGCANKVKGVQTESGSKIEIHIEDFSWYPDHVCEGSHTIQFSRNEFETKAAFSIGMAAYISEKGPIFFRCNEKLAYNVCSCTNIVLGNTWRD